jgi:hypothetical protein
LKLQIASPITSSPGGEDLFGAAVGLGATIQARADTTNGTSTALETWPDRS